MTSIPRRPDAGPLVIALASLKGDVGRTTSAVQIAAHLAHAGEKVLLADDDRIRSATGWGRGGQLPFTVGRMTALGQPAKYSAIEIDSRGGLEDIDLVDLAEALAFHHNAIGAVAGPFDAWLTLRGLKTLSLRMDRHCDNAELVVGFLADHPAVTQVFYPGLADHPGHEVAARQMRRFGGMVSFRVAGGEELLPHSPRPPDRFAHRRAAAEKARTGTDALRTAKLRL